MTTAPNLNLVEVGEYWFAWVGRAGSKKPARVRGVVHGGQGHADTMAAARALVGSDDRPSTCVAMGKGRPVILRDIAHESDRTSWAETALRFGYRSMIALPLKEGATPFGSFSIFSAESSAFRKKEVALLEVLAQDLACGIVQRVRVRGRARPVDGEVDQGERNRILTTLQEGVGQSMQAVNLGLKRGRAMAAKKEPVLTELLDQLSAEVGSAIQGLRDLGQELRLGFLEHLPFPDAIRLHCQETSLRAGIAIDVRAKNTGFELDKQVKEQGFFCFREALDNAVRHAQASRIEVSLEVGPSGWLHLEIRDNGVGFDTRQASRRFDGLGLCAIRERAESVFGRAKIQSFPRHGTRVRISVPLSLVQPVKSAIARGGVQARTAPHTQPEEPTA
ncbi:MAG: GAF domain-containing protein [Chromatiaceae bacterium]|nr:GAF domain-containing protein [Chromatiaceae bacterium]